jgi:hypothetical protein
MSTLLTRVRPLWTAHKPDATHAIDLALCLLMLDLLFRPVGSWHVRPFVLAIAALALLTPRVRHAPLPYLLIALAAAFRIAYNWPMSDNHAYLLVYWPLAVAIALLSAQPGAALAAQSRWIVACVFGFAVLWKAALTDEFIDGTFFRVTFQADSRFEDFVLAVGGLTSEQLETNRAYLSNPMPAGAVPLEPAPYVEPAAFKAIVAFFVWSTLLLEGALFLVYVAPTRPRIELLRNVLLLAFCIGTYALAPVAGFGWILLAMATAQLPVTSRFRYAYVATFLLLLLYRENSWRDLVWGMLD